MMEDKPRLTNGIVNSYALSNGMNTIAQTVPLTYLNMFMTDYLGISPVALGTGMLIAKTVDFIVSIFAGMIIEKSNMKHGKYLSWIRLLTVTLFFGNVVQMLDTTAFISSPTIRLVIVMIFYMMFHCSMDFLVTSRAAIIPKLAGTDMEARKKLTARQSQVGAAVSIIGSATILPIVSFVQNLTGSDSMGYFVAALLFSAIFVVVNLNFVKLAAPFDPPADAAAPAKKSPTAKQMLDSVVGNKQMLILFSGFVCFTIGSQIYTGALTYFFRVNGIFEYFTLAQTIRAICAFGASMVAPSVGRKFGKKGALMVGWIVCAAGNAMMWLVGMNADGTPNLVMVIISMCLCQSARYIYMAFNANYYLDCGEYGYASTGIDNRTMAVTVMNWPTKIGFALGGSLIGYVLAWAGYVAPTGGALPSFQYMNRFMIAIGLIPAVCMLAGALIILLFYKLTDEQAAQYARQNAEREAAR